MLGDFNTSIEDSFMKNICENYDLSSLLKEPTCIKNPENPSCIDQILTNKPRSFIKTGVIETGLSDYHKLVTTVMKMHFPKSKPSIITHWSYKKFDNKKFMETLNAEIIRNKWSLSLLRKAKKEYFSSLNINKVAENKSFWKIVKPFLSNKTISSQKITLIDDDELITD